MTTPVFLAPRARMCRKNQESRHVIENIGRTGVFALRARMCCKNQHKPRVGLIAFTSTSEPMCCKNQYKRQVGFRAFTSTKVHHRRFQHFQCRMCRRNQYKRHVELRALCQRSRMCCNSQYKRHVGLRTSTIKCPGCAVKTSINGMSHENVGHTDMFGTSSVGCAVKMKTACTSSRVYVNVGACNSGNNNNNINSSSHKNNQPLLLQRLHHHPEQQRP